MLVRAGSRLVRQRFESGSFPVCFSGRQRRASRGRIIGFTLLGGGRLRNTRFDRVKTASARQLRLEQGGMSP